ncbi:MULTISPECIES: hypothetical protein [unclassified Nonomuraea]|uniref:hypothetical protein n=1 Tax=unclassified Nonomuraea TaxID=2593643 RepID=UPI0035C0AC0A
MPQCLHTLTLSARLGRTAGAITQMIDRLQIIHGFLVATHRSAVEESDLLAR